MTVEEPQLVSVAGHPRAAESVRRAKSWAGLLAFALVLGAGLLGGVGTSTALGRAIAGGVVGYVAVWAAAVAVWRHLLRAEARAVLERAAAIRAEHRNAA